MKIKENNSLKGKSWEPVRICLLNSTGNPANFHPNWAGLALLFGSNQVRVVAFALPQLTQTSFIQKNQTLQNRFLISVTLRWHKASVACKYQKSQSF